MRGGVVVAGLCHRLLTLACAAVANVIISSWFIHSGPAWRRALRLLKRSGRGWRMRGGVVVAGPSTWRPIRKAPVQTAGSPLLTHGLGRRLRCQIMRNASVFWSVIVAVAAVACACLFRGHVRVRRAWPPGPFAVEIFQLIILLHEHKEWTRNGGGMEKEPRCKRGACLLGK